MIIRFSRLVLLALSLGLDALAQLGVDEIPDLSSYASGIANAASGKPVAAEANGKLFSTTLDVPSVHPGAAARKFGAQLRSWFEKAAGPKPEFARMEQLIPQVMVEQEADLVRKGFSKRDFGIAVASAFLFSYQTATNKQVPDAAARAAERTIAKSIEAAFGPDYAKMTASRKESAYESLLVIAPAFFTFAQEFEKGGKAVEASEMRDAANSMFRKLTGVDPNQVNIGPDGRIGGLQKVSMASQDSARSGDVKPAAPSPTHAVFSAAVRARTGDWVAEDRYNYGWLLTHPEKFNQYSDVSLSFSAAHILTDNPQKLAIEWSNGFDLGHNIPVPANAPVDIPTPGVYSRFISYNWIQNFLAQVGVVVLPNRRYAMFFSRCYADREDYYPSQACQTKVISILTGLHNGSLMLPAPPAPLNIIGWNSRYTYDGTASAERQNFHLLYKAVVLAATPRAIPQASLKAAIREYADGHLPETSIRKLDPSQVTKESPLEAKADGAVYVGARFYSERTGDAPYQIFGAIRIPDGRYSLYAVLCPTIGWQAICEYGMKSALQYAASGEIEEERLRIVRAWQPPDVANPLRGEQVEAAYARMKSRMMAGGYFGNEPLASLMLLRDGSAFAGFGIGFDVVLSKRQRPKLWGMWQRSGDGILVKWPDGKAETLEKSATLLAGGRNGQRLSGMFRRVGGGGNTAWGGAISSLFDLRYYFTPDGHFTYEGSSGVSAGLNSTADTATGAGTYEVEPYALKLTYPDGRVTRLAFAIYASDANKTEPSAVFLNGDMFFRPTR